MKGLHLFRSIGFYSLKLLKAGIAKLKLEKKVINSTSFDSQAVINPENGDSKETAE
jgi:hypothetical protein